MRTLTMNGIAELANVRRPVVSVWRTRHATGTHPFPRPVDEAALTFDADEVGRWLADTGRGNNPDAAVESALHSSTYRQVAARVDDASTLLLLHHLSGGPVASLDLAAAADLITVHGLTAVTPLDSVAAALADSELANAVDDVAEAAFSAQRVLDRLVGDHCRADGAWRDGALTDAGVQLVGTVLAELLRARPADVVPLGDGGLVLAHALSGHLDESERPTFACLPSATVTEVQRSAWRRLAAHDCAVTPCDEVDGTPDLAGASLLLLQHQAVSDAEIFFDEVGDALVAVGPDDTLVVVGPALFMTDPASARSRRRLLVPTFGNEAPLRYVARLPKGLSRFGGRRRLALWVFSRTTTDRPWTVAGAHSDIDTDEGACQAIAADVAASITAADVNAHAFRSSAVRASDRFLRLASLTIAPTAGDAVDGTDHHARILELDRGLLGDVTFAASAPAPEAMTFTAATRELGRDLPGTRIASEHITPPAAGAVAVIGPEEIRDPLTRGRRAIDRLRLEEVAPRARLTERGDVIYVGVGGPAAFVDHDGGHVVLSPARIFRCRDAEDGGHQLVPEVVAADIARQPRPERDTWWLRTVSVTRAPALDEMTRRTRRRREDLLDELQAIDALETELIDAMSAGSLTAEIDAADAAEEV